MKRSMKNLSGLAVIFSMFLFVGCEGPAGEDGNDTCKECHNQTHMSAIAAQYETSGHAAGTNVGYAGGRYNCAACHSHEGFVETQHTKRDTTATAIAIPTRIDCKTCHDGHVSFDTTDGPDYALRAKSAVALLITKKEKSVDFGSSSNLCANCHQPRTAAPVANADGEFRITSGHYGPHYGTQTTYLQGIGAYEFSGSTAYPAEGSSAHAASGACVSCHMGEADDNGGGHTFAANVAGCTSCHSSATTLDINGVQTEVHDMLDELSALLKGKGVLDAEGNVIPGTYPAEVAQAFYNYKGVKVDRSYGVHNPAYIKAVLKNTIAKMK